MWWVLVAFALAAPGDPGPYGGSLLPSPSPAPDLHGTHDPFSWQVPATEVNAGGATTLMLRLVVPPGTHVYRDGIEVRVIDPGGLVVGAPDLPPGLKQADPGDPTGDVRELYDSDVLIAIPVSSPSANTGLFTVALDLRHQGCKPGLCYPPVQTAIGALVHVAAR